jgi:hypothetical protein
MGAWPVEVVKRNVELDSQEFRLIGAERAFD